MTNNIEYLDSLDFLDWLEATAPPEELFTTLAQLGRVVAIYFDEEMERYAIVRPPGEPKYFKERNV